MIDRLFAAVTLSASLMVAQTAATPDAVVAAAASESHGKAPAFDIVSIKPALPPKIWHFGFGPTGYEAAGVQLRIVIYQAYFAFNMADKDAVSGAPDWVGKDVWDIETKVAPEDLAEYQKERMQVDTARPLAHEMLQSALAERCKLVVHRVPAEMPAFAIVIAKNGAQLTEAKPDEARPSEGQDAPGGGFLVPYHRGDTPHVTYYGVSMATFAALLRGMAGRPVIDRTGLTGRYNFSLKWLSLDPDEREGVTSTDDPDPLSHWNLGALGLKVERIQVTTEHIVIDHIEKPSDN